MSSASRPEQPGIISADDECRSECLRALRLPEPLTSVLITPTDAPGLARAWRRIEARLDEVQPPLSAIRRSRTWGACAAIVAVSAMLVVLGWMADWRVSVVQGIGLGERSGTVTSTTRVDRPSAPRIQRAPPELANEGLLLRDGAEFNGVDARAGSVALTFEDGSTLSVAKNGAVEPLVMNKRDVILRLKAGTVNVSVVPGGSRRWVVQAGAVSIEVVGTRFTVERTDARVVVHVSRGSVVVRSEHLPERVERLGASEALTVVTSSDTASKAPKKPLPQPKIENSISQAGGVSTLLEQADQARLRADWSTAGRALERVVKDFAGDPRAPVAAYQLAMVRQKQGASPTILTGAFARALDMASGASLRQDCYWRLAQAQMDAGQRAAAAQTARSALDEFPDGRYSERLREQLAGGEDE